MNNDITKLKRLDIWSNFIKIKDILEPCYAFLLKDTGYRLYIIDYGNGETDRWWVGRPESYKDGEPLNGTLPFEVVFDSLDERMKEKFVFNMDILV